MLKWCKISLVPAAQGGVTAVCVSMVNMLGFLASASCLPASPSTESLSQETTKMVQISREETLHFMSIVTRCPRKFQQGFYTDGVNHVQHHSQVHRISSSRCERIRGRLGREDDQVCEKDYFPGIFLPFSIPFLSFLLCFGIPPSTSPSSYPWLGCT